MIFVSVCKASELDVNCPLSGSVASPDIYIEFLHGQKVFFCCADCLKQFMENPLPFISEQTGIPIEDSKYFGKVFHCPVSGSELTVDSNTSKVQFKNGQTIFFCCDHCIESFKENPSAYMTTFNSK